MIDRNFKSTKEISKKKRLTNKFNDINWQPAIIGII